MSTAPYRYQARITLYTSPEQAAGRISPAIGVLEALGPDTCLLHTGSNSLDELAVYTGLFGFPFRVHEPPELVAHIGHLARRFADAVEASTQPSP